jgi:hypothetical protein
MDTTDLPKGSLIVDHVAVCYDDRYSDATSMCSGHISNRHVHFTTFLKANSS